MIPPPPPPPQSYEGGIGGEPGNEAHGGYTYCGLAALCLLDRCQALDIPSLESWVAALQAPFEGGYAGRTNKLVDGCYSFWQGAVLPLLDRYAPSNARATETRTEQRPDQDLSPETLAARALVHSLAVRLEAAEKLEAEVGGTGLWRRIAMMPVSDQGRVSKEMSKVLLDCPSSVDGMGLVGLPFIAGPILVSFRSLCVTFRSPASP